METVNPKPQVVSCSWCGDSKALASKESTVKLGEDVWGPGFGVQGLAALKDVCAPSQGSRNCGRMLKWLSLTSYFNHNSFG